MSRTALMLILGLIVLPAVGASASVLENISVTPEVEVEEGETAILNCSVHSVPTADLLWIQDGVILRQVRSNWVSLVLQNASRFHLKLFTCQATNQYFPLKFLRGTTLIRIKGTYEVVAKPHLAPRDLPVLHRPFRLDCTVFDLPFHFVVERLSYTWYKDDKEIQDQSKSTLLILSLSKDDGGMYACAARYENVMSTSPQSNDHEVLVLVPPVVHMEPRSPKNIIKWAAGKNLTLTCNVTYALPGVPSTGYSWSYLPSLQGQLRPLEARESTLTLGPVTEEESGQYFCQARSDPDFQGELPPGKASVTVDVVYLKDISLTSDLVVNEGDHVVLTCAVKCQPKAHLVWSVDGQEVRHVTANVDHYVVEKTACSDSKTYTCHASNVAVSGLEKTASTRLLVNCSQKDENDILLMPNMTTSMQIPEGDRLTLTCKAKFTSTPVQRGDFSWTFSPSDSRAKQRLGETGPRLTLGPLTRGDSGRFTCQAGNKAEDSGQSSIHVTVTVSAEMNSKTIDSDGPGDVIKIAVPIIVIIAVAILVSVGIGVLFWQKKLCFDRSVKKTPEDKNASEPLQKNQEASEP